jgi:exo-beta-1,3-glucanase (GH17 family)
MSYYGVAFQPYVGPWVGGQPVLFNAYTQAQVTELLQAIAPYFTRVATYGQGTFVWQGVPRIQDSNKYNIAAASAAGLKVSAGCYQQGANPGGDSIDVAWTKTEVDYALAQAQAFPGTVDELIVGTECIWGPNSTAAITTLIDYAKKKIKTARLAIKVSTRQRWDVLAGVGDPVKDMLAACDGFVYADIYPYFDPGIAAAIGPNPTQSSFSAAVTSSFLGSYNALHAAFSGNGVTTEIRVGEVGWPTSGSQPAQPDISLATRLYAEWHFAAIKALLATQKIKGFAFEAYNEPWKGQAGNSEAHFGVMVAQGSAPSVSQYTLTGETAKYTP